MEHLVDLSLMRLNLADEVAMSKWRSHKAIEDPSREQALLMQVREEASMHRVSADFAASFFMDQIAASKSVQSGLIDQWHQEGGSGKEHMPSLDMLRSRLDGLTQRLLNALGDIEPLRGTDACRVQLKNSLAAVRQRNALDALHASGLEQALRGVCTGGMDSAAQEQEKS